MLRETCPRCGGRLRIQMNRREHRRFVGCSRFPSCRYTEQYDDLVDDLYARIDALQFQLDCRRAPSSPSGMDGGAVSASLKALVVRFHPDKNPDGLDANSVCAALNDLRDKVDR